MIGLSILTSTTLAGCLNSFIKEEQLLDHLNKFEQELDLIGLSREDLVSIHGKPEKHSHSYINGNVKIEHLIFSSQGRSDLRVVLIDDIVKVATYDKID